MLLKSHVYLTLFYLDCRVLNKHLMDFIDGIKLKLITRILHDNRKLVRKY